MTASPRTPSLEFDGIDDIAAAIRARGGRVSTVRRQVLRAMFEADGPVSAERIASGLSRDGNALELASVYRNLESLEALGAIKHVHLGHGPGLYSLVGGGQREYLACERCNRVMSIASGELDGVRREIRRRFGYEARFTHFPITGLCPDCAALQPSDQPSEQGALPMSDEHEHHEHEEGEKHAHAHEHDGEEHTHAHDSHDHEHTEHEHEHSHGDRIHAHPHVHQEDLEGDHDHEHDE